MQKTLVSRWYIREEKGVCTGKTVMAAAGSQKRPKLSDIVRAIFEILTLFANEVFIGALVLFR